MDKYLIINEKISSAMHYSDFKEYCQKIIKELESKEIDESEKSLLEYRKLNLARINRVEKSYFPSTAIKNLVVKLQKQTWLVITEDWCGDSAQNLPAIANIASLNENIDLKIILRDQNLELMDFYLTDGKRSIPKVVALDKNLNELFIWGPRPKNAQTYFEKLKNEGLIKDDIIKNIHSWYAKDKCKSLEEELVELLSGIN